MDIRNKTIVYVTRNKNFIGRGKSQKVSVGLSQMKVNLSDDVDVCPVKNNPSSYSDVAANSSGSTHQRSASLKLMQEMTCV